MISCTHTPTTLSNGFAVCFTCGHFWQAGPIKPGKGRFDEAQEFIRQHREDRQREADSQIGRQR